jgi:hypothetical protein
MNFTENFIAWNMSFGSATCLLSIVRCFVFRNYGDSIQHNKLSCRMLHIHSDDHSVLAACLHNWSFLVMSISSSFSCAQYDAISTKICASEIAHASVTSMDRTIAQNLWVTFRKWLLGNLSETPIHSCLSSVSRGKCCDSMPNLGHKFSFQYKLA